MVQTNKSCQLGKAETMTQKYELVNLDGQVMWEGSLNECLLWLVSEFPNATIENIVKAFRFQEIGEK